MTLLLRLLLCLTLLANTAGGAWATPAHDMGARALPAPASAAAHDCHDLAGPGGMSMPDHGAVATQQAAHGHAPSDPGCCQHAGCDCLQHCGTSLGLPAAIAAIGPRGQSATPPPLRRPGLPQPYQPVRPPIA